MPDKDIAVVVWEKDEKGSHCNTKWRGSNHDLSCARIIMHWFVGQKLIEMQEAKNTGNPGDSTVASAELQEIRPDVALLPEIKNWRITILECIKHRDEAAGESPPILESLGDDTLEIFQRVHFD